MLLIEVEVKAEGPLQTAEVAAFTDIKRLPFSHTGLLCDINGLGVGFTIIEAVAAAVQLSASPITVYCVLETGLSVNTGVVTLSGVEACHV